MFEAFCYPFSSFLTLTYSDENLPLSPSGLAQCSVADAQKFLKRFRYYLGQLSIDPARINGGILRYFVTAELGRQTLRPHLHGALFGIDPIVAEIVVQQAWTLGHASVSEFNANRASYLLKDVVKGRFTGDHPLLGDRSPEFNLRSKNPALGVPILDHLEKLQRLPAGQRDIEATGDIRWFARRNGQKLLLDDFLRSGLRKRLDVGETARERGRGSGTGYDASLEEEARKQNDKLLRAIRRKQYLL